MLLDPLDYLAIVVYILVVVGVGVYFARQQKSTSDYFLGGRSMGCFPLAASMYVTIFSSISFVMGPAEAFRQDLQFLVSLLFFPLASLLAVALFVDFFLRQGITTVFEYLELRFNAGVSTFIMVAYMLMRSLYAGIVVFTISLVIHVTMGVPLIPIMALVGTVTIVYTMMGGLKAVIWADVIQFFILYIGILSILGLVIGRVPGGMTEIWQTAAAAGKLRIVNWEFNLTEHRYVVWTLVAYGIVDFLGAKSTDQMIVQRYLSAKSAFHGKMALLIQSFFSLPTWLLLYAVGICLYSYYSVFPSPIVQRYIDNNQFDMILPHFIYDVVPAGLRGLLIAALLAAAMSTISSVLNTLSAVSETNIYRRWLRPNAPQREQLVVGRLLTLGWGIIIIVAAVAMIDIESIMRAAVGIIGMFVGPILGVFLLGMFSRRTNPRGVTLGLLAGFSFSLYLNYLTSITFTVFGVGSLMATLLTGYVASLFFDSPSSEDTAGLLWQWHGWRETFLGGPNPDQFKEEIQP